MNSLVADVSQVYELHHLYQTQKTLMGDYGCKEPDVYKFLEERLHLPIRPYTNLMHYPSLEEGKLSRNFAVSECVIRFKMY